MITSLQARASPALAVHSARCIVYGLRTNVHIYRRAFIVVSLYAGSILVAGPPGQRAEIERASASSHACEACVARDISPSSRRCTLHRGGVWSAVH